MAELHRNRAGGAPPPFMQIGVVNTQAATDIEDMFVNVKRNISLKWRRFNELPEFQKVKGANKPITLVGGGPSLKDPKVQKELEYWAKIGPVMAAGSSHDWLIKFGINPDYTSVCDADPITALYTREKNNNPNAKYLLASCCDAAIYNAVPKEQIIMWHCHSEDILKRIIDEKLETNYHGVGGGCTVGLRSISLAIMLGYTNIHLFGYDSCVASMDDHHAYNFEDVEKEFIGTMYKIRIGIAPNSAPNYDGPIGPGEKEYLCAGYQLAQVAHFKEFYMAHRHVFTPTFHGEGLLKDHYELMKKMELIEQERAA